MKASYKQVKGRKFGKEPRRVLVYGGAWKNFLAASENRQWTRNK
ncbi:hypothetical protein SOVF_131040 [Spinacia oleracea]|nr:hypothetical protein SOVF_131040 [Spinacia oleracea]